MNICCLCKKNEGTIINDRYITKKYGEVVRYSCRDCNSARARKYRTTKKGHNVYKILQRKQYIKNRLKILCRQKLNQFLKKNGLSAPEICSVCKKIKKLDAHHEDYSQPLRVKWVCRQCHFMIHERCG